MNASLAHARDTVAGSVRDSAEIQAAFALFNQVSAELSDSYRLLERRVEELSSELEQVDRARLRERRRKKERDLPVGRDRLIGIEVRMGVAEQPRV